MQDLLNIEDVEEIEKDDLLVGDVISVVHENKGELYVDEDEITYISGGFGVRTPFADNSDNENFHSDGGAGISNLQDEAYTIYRH